MVDTSVNTYFQAYSQDTLYKLVIIIFIRDIRSNSDNIQTQTIEIIVI